MRRFCYACLACAGEQGEAVTVMAHGVPTGDGS